MHTVSILPACLAHVLDAESELVLKEACKGGGGLSQAQHALHARAVALRGELRETHCQKGLLVASQIVIVHAPTCRQ